MNAYDGWGINADGTLSPLPNYEPDPRVTVWRVTCSDRGQDTPARLLGFVADRRTAKQGDIVGWKMPTGNAEKRSRVDRRRTRQGIAAFMSQSERPVEHSRRMLFGKCSCGRDIRLNRQDVAALIDRVRENDPTRHDLDVSWLS